MKLILVLFYLVSTTSGLVFMKLGGNAGSFAFKEGTIGFSINWISAIGFMFYLVSFLLFTKIIIMFDLSYIFPICTGIVQVITLIVSKIIFKESFSSQGIIGASIIILGIIIMNIPKNIGATA